MISVLYVEDDTAQARVLDLLLRGRGFVLHHAATTGEARYLLERLPIDIALVDGELGDGKVDERSDSGRFVENELLGRIPFGRLSGNPAAIPRHLRGAFTIGKPYRVDEVERALLAALGVAGGGTHPQPTRGSRAA